jgi:hypothetical protein
MHDQTVAIHVTPTVAEALCIAAGILRTENGMRGDPALDHVPIGVWYDTENDRWTWALDQAARWAVVRLAEMDPEWEDAVK